MAKGHKLPPKVERCIKHVKAKGHDKTSAIKICQASVRGKDKKKS